jgi:formylglycine-generating enzyme required for sulfatase activity
MANTSNGSGISRVGSSGSYTYSVDAAFVKRPVNYVSWGDAARFTNWLHNGQGGGSTEEGAYYLNGATSDAELMAVTRNADARYWIPTEDEWYKAAYHQNDGATGNYFSYPTGSNTVPGRDMADASGNNANYSGNPYPIDSPYYTTKVGEFENSDSPYGTFDQGGNVWEWNETAKGWRGVRGGGWGHSSDYLLASYRDAGGLPTHELDRLGFRVASVPEPASITLMLCGAIAGLLWWKRSR